MESARKRLLDAARALGFKGAASEVKQWLADEGIEIVDKETGKAFDIDAALATKTVYVTADAKEDVQFVESEDSEDKSEEDDDSEKMDEGEDGEKRWDRSRFHRESGRKNKVYEVDGKNYMGGKGPHIRSAHARAAKAYNHKADRNGVGIKHGQTAFYDYDQAEQFGAIARVGIWGDKYDYSERSRDLEVLKSMGVKLNSRGNLGQGGAYAIEEFSDTIYDLMEKYGVFRRHAAKEPMGSSTRNYTVDGNSGVDVYWAGEGSATTETNVDTQRHKLVAEKLFGLTRVSNELMNEAGGLAGDRISRRFAARAANKEDLAGFTGDGSATFGGFMGIIPRLTGVASNAGVITASGNEWSEIVAGDLYDMLGSVPNFENIEGEEAWFCHKSFFYKVIVPIQAGFLGTDPALVANALGEAGGDADFGFMGRKGYFTQVMSNTDTASGSNSTVPLLLGYMGVGAVMGDVRGGLAIDTSDQRYFDTDETAFRAIEEVAISVHSPGTSTEAGPIVALQMAAS